MADEERIRWAQHGDAALAFRVLGDGDPAILLLTGFMSHIEVQLEEPGLERFYRRLAAIGRVILMDRRGSGLSDRALPPAWDTTLEVGDVDAVLDAAGAERAVILGYAAGGLTAVTYAAERPERVTALVLYASMVSIVADDEVTWANSPDERAARAVELAERWGTGVNLEQMAPSAADDERLRAWLSKLERLSMTPQGMTRVWQAFAGADVRPLLPAIRVPTLVVHRTDDQLIDVRHSRLFAERIPNAKLVELPGVDSLPQIGDVDALVGEIEELLTGGRRGSLERELLTVLFTDVVDATGHAARLGDARWRALLEVHLQVVRRALRRHGGEELKTVGDGVLATFTSPSAALRCARAVVDEAPELGLELRAGLHTGECERMGGDVGGMAVHIAARVGALAGPGEVLASGTTYGTVVGSGLAFEDRGSQELKGVPGRWPLFALARG